MPSGHESSGSAVASPLIENEPKSARLLASQPAKRKSTVFKSERVERPDWTLFRSIATLGQKSGVPAKHLRRLALKELVDNALDAGGEVSIEQSGDRYIIQDDGPGIDGAPKHVAKLFSIDRGMVSSKLWRKPQRGALGNGLRVVAGCLIASGGGSLIVRTRNKRMAIVPGEDGGATVSTEKADFPHGTKIEISFGPYLAEDDYAMDWAQAAIDMAQGGAGYDGSPSAHWFDAEAFYELVHYSGARPVRDLVSKFDGCTGAKAGQIAAAFLGRQCDSMSFEETAFLLGHAQALTRVPSIKRLGSVGDLGILPKFRSSESGTITVGSREPRATIPFVVEAWAEVSKDESDIQVYVNRTPVTGDVRLSKGSDKKLAIWGCNLSHQLADVPKQGKWCVFLNITAPFIPITTDGKEPDLSHFLHAIHDAICGAIKRAQRGATKTKKATSIKDVVLDNLDDAINKTSGDRKYRFEQRQLLYALRPIVMRITGKELKESNFSTIITEYESEHGEIGLMHRQERGAIYHPGGGRDIPVGTLMVEKYERPTWGFNKIVYIEKHGFFESLQSDSWPERHDCALITSKGFTTRAVKDLIDHLAQHGEPVKVFCVHDADAAGTMIFETFQNETPARAARTVEIINFGLEPWEARDMGLEAEPFEKTDKRRPVADYVMDRGDGEYWAEWLQSNRYELNAMTTPQFLEWITSKIEDQGIGKVVPPVEIIESEATEILQSELRDRITKRVLREANIDDQVSAALAAITMPSLTEAGANEWLEENPLETWRAYVDDYVIAPLGDREF